jgi:hypothetical protein
MIRLDLLPENAMLRRLPFRELIQDFQFRVFYKRGKGSRRELFDTFAIAPCSFNELCEGWTKGWEWWLEPRAN